MGITRLWIRGPKSRSVNNSSQQSDFGLLGLIWDKFSYKQLNVLIASMSKQFLNTYSARHNYPGGGSKCAEKAWAPPGAAKHEMEQLKFLTHGNGRYGHYKNLVFRLKIEKCQQFSPATVFWTSVGFHPPGKKA